MNEPCATALLEHRPTDSLPVPPPRVPRPAPRAPEPDPARCLSSTRYMDIHHPLLEGARAELLADAPAPREAAMRLFEFVRDEIRYAFGPWGIQASRTLEQREGTCSNKNTLLVALLRGAGIPAACGVLRVNALEYFGSLAPPYLKLFLKDSSKRSTHIYAGVFLDGRWIKIDPTTDREISERTAHFCSQTRLVEWDGARDAMDFIEPEHIHADLGLLASIDHLLDKPARTARPSTLAVGNDYLRFIRSEPSFPSAERLAEAYGARLGFADVADPAADPAPGAPGEGTGP